MKQINWTRVLTILLVFLAGYALLYITGSILSRFKHALLIFVLGAMLAYVLTPLVNRLTLAIRVRWASILLSYLLLAGILFVLGVLLFTPFIQQSQALVDNLHTPSLNSLQSVSVVQRDARTLQTDLKAQQQALRTGGITVTQDMILRTRTDINRLQADVLALQTGTINGAGRGVRLRARSPGGRLPPNPRPQTQVPMSYVRPIASNVNLVASNYTAATRDPLAIDPVSLGQAQSHAKFVRQRAKRMQDVMLSMPVLLLRAQTWLDQHNVGADLHSKFGEAARQISDQGTNILDNAVTILSETANTLLNLALILIIAFYLLSDGSRLIHGGINLIPVRYREQVWYFIQSLDKVLGGYVRGQLLLSALAGILGGGGAAALGVPFPLLIGIMTFLLESIPVIGPIVALVPAVVISLFFMPFLSTVLLLAWNMIFQQLVTNVLGPRILGSAVGIHPLEAMMAVLVGYPLGGFLGAFLAVPVAGIVHILIRELYGYFVLGKSLPTATVVVTGVDGLPSTPSESSTEGRQQPVEKDPRAVPS
ncbi:MAG: hypothetical protein NVSMB52_09850 [Chloroflexota bacterium]